MESLLADIRACTVCSPYLEMGPRPVVAASIESKIIIIGQAPGKKVHLSGIPWKDASGDNLRRWLGVDEAQFYDTQHFAIVPMGFCYPGKGKSGDLPPRKECAPLWHRSLLEAMDQTVCILLVGQYAQRYYLGDQIPSTLTETVRQYKTYLPRYFPLPHPSPRNNIWQKKNPWFISEVIPHLQSLIQQQLSA